MSKKNYKVVCSPLDLVLVVKKFNLEEEKRLYDSVQKKLNSAKEPIRVDTYKDFILKEFLVDYLGLIEMLPTDLEEKSIVIEAVYNAITDLYVPFKLEIVCADINSGLFLEGEVSEVIQKIQKKFAKNVLKYPEAELETFCSGIQTMKDLEDLEQNLLDNIIGQDEAVKTLIKNIKLNAAGLANHTSLMFVGPTGVGKSELAKILGQSYSGNFFKINCAEYSNGHEYAKLIGSPPGYVGHSEKSLLGEKAEKSNKWVFLFDEIEKAHEKFYDFLLSLLDDGTCTDNMGNILDFSESIFIFTSNQGMSKVSYGKKLGFGSCEVDDLETFNQSKDLIVGSVKEKFSSEFINRIDDILLFNALTKDDIFEIVHLNLEELPIVVSEELVNYVVEGAYSVEYGARNIKRFIKNNITTHIADAILNNKVPKTGDYYKFDLSESEAKIIDLKNYTKPRKKRTKKVSASGTS